MTVTQTSITKNKNRFSALDVMRGLTLALMIVVNTPGSWSAIYWPLAHADWNGVTPTDFVFPFFLFIVGASLFFSLPKLNQLSPTERWVKLLKRTLLLFVVGVLVSNFPFNQPLDHWRIMGVLQRIALAYFLASLMCLYLTTVIRLLVVAVILVGYWALLNLVVDPYGLETNLVRQIDLQIFGADHLWHGKQLAFDPEGLLSTFPAVINVLIGYKSLSLLQSAEKNSMKKLWLLAGILLSSALVWNLSFPFNKSLWTSSFALLTSSAAVVVLILVHYFCRLNFAWVRSVEDMCKVLGSNPLFIYVLSEIFVVVLYMIPVNGQSLYSFIYQLFTQLADPYLASLIFALFYLALMWLVAWVLYRKKIFISL